MLRPNTRLKLSAQVLECGIGAHDRWWARLGVSRLLSGRHAVLLSTAGPSNARLELTPPVEVELRL
jgi:hypothetical protein